MIELFAGKDTDKTVLWIDLWGAKSMIGAHMASNGNIIPRANIAQKMSTFISLLATMAKGNPNLEIAQGSDGAFIISDDPDLVFKTAIDIFQNIHVITGKFHLIPIRGGLAHNLVETLSNHSTLQPISNLNYLPYLGEGFVKSTVIEKIGPKGMRLFIVESLKNRLSNSNQSLVLSKVVGQVNVMGEVPENYYEVLWMDQTFFDHKFDDEVIVSDEVRATGKLWKEKGDKFQQEVGESILEQVNEVDSRTE